MENNVTKKFNCIVVILSLWMLIILFIFTMVGEKTDKKSSQNLDYRQHQSVSNYENRTNVTERLNRLELSREPSDHYKYKGPINDEDVFFFIDAGLSDISNFGHISERI